MTSTFRTILVPTDFSEGALASLDNAIGLSKVLGSKIILLHAYSIPVIPSPEGGLAMSADLLSRILSASEEAIAKLAEKVTGEGVAAQLVVKQGDPRDTILGVAQETDADLICMGTHGRRGLARALIGSVAESIVRSSPIPVLTIRARAK